jgi:adenosine deaminase CECR1
MPQIIQKGIAIEICPISNQLLGYVEDLRNHPATAMLAAGVPITISSDDPGLMGYESVVLDWWEVSQKQFNPKLVNWCF